MRPEWDSSFSRFKVNVNLVPEILRTSHFGVKCDCFLLPSPLPPKTIWITRSNFSVNIENEIAMAEATSLDKIVLNARARRCSIAVHSKSALERLAAERFSSGFRNITEFLKKWLNMSALWFYEDFV